MRRYLTVAELASALTALCEKHPELSDRHVLVPSECGYSGGTIAYPFVAWVDEFDSSDGDLIIHSDDDGIQSTIARDHYKFYSEPAPKWVYRLEARSSKNGLWYNRDNEYVWGIGKIENCKTKDLPMDYDERYHKDGRDWYSSCSRKEDLSHWYSLEDALALIEDGFVFTRYLATEYVEYENETTFIRETSLFREELDIKEIWYDNG